MYGVLCVAVLLVAIGSSVAIWLCCDVCCGVIDGVVCCSAVGCHRVLGCYLAEAPGGGGRQGREAAGGV